MYDILPMTQLEPVHPGEILAGTPTPEAMTLAEISRLIRIAGREPVERDTFYNVVSLPA